MGVLHFNGFLPIFENNALFPFEAALEYFQFDDSHVVVESDNLEVSNHSIQVAR
jgi:hypothetical protein